MALETTLYIHCLTNSRITLPIIVSYKHPDISEDLRIDYEYGKLQEKSQCHIDSELQYFLV